MSDRKFLYVSILQARKATPFQGVDVSSRFVHEMFVCRSTLKNPIWIVSLTHLAVNLVSPLVQLSQVRTKREREGASVVVLAVSHCLLRVLFNLTRDTILFCWVHPHCLLTNSQGLCVKEATLPTTMELVEKAFGEKSGRTRISSSNIRVPEY